MSASIQETEVNHLTDAEQDELIARVAKKLVDDLQKFVGGARPRSEFKFWVTGPHEDPIQGRIHVHHLAAKFDLDELPNTCGAYRTHVMDQPGVQVVQRERETITVADPGAVCACGCGAPAVEGVPVADHPHMDPGDKRTECQTCGKFVHQAIHSCKGVPVTVAAKARQ